jgi:hypothetical protein
MIKHHVKEEEKRSEGMLAQAKGAGLDIEALGEQMAQEKTKLTAKYKSSGLPKPQTLVGTQATRKPAPLCRAWFGRSLRALDTATTSMNQAATANPGLNGKLPSR